MALADPLAFDVDATIERLATGIVAAVGDLGRRGAVVAVSGGIDSAACAGLAVRALGPDHVVALRLPEKDITSLASDLGLELAEKLGIRNVEETITPALEGLGCYERRDEAIRMVFPDYEPTWKHKIVRSAPTGAIIVHSIVVETPDGEERKATMPAAAYRKIIAATNMKQRVRKLFEYTYADELGYAVIGTPNYLEYDQGFFVKGGDGLADIKPIAKLFKTQVYEVARALELPEGITGRAPTTDTFSLPQSQEEFYFGHAYPRMDLLMWGFDNDVPAGELAPRVELTPDEVTAGYWEIERRRTATAYLHAPATLLEGAVPAAS